MSSSKTTPLIPALAAALWACGPDVAPELESAEQRVTAPACSATKLAELLAPATAAAPSVVLDCTATLPAGTTLTKKVIIQGASGRGARLDCAGGTLAPTQSGGGAYSLAIRSQRVNGAWVRPEDVVVERCTIRGSVRVYGLGVNGEAAEVRASSRLAGHTARAQAAAPTRVTLDRLRIVAAGPIPLYLSPGTTYVSLTRSDIGGTGSSVAIYLDAESGHHLIRDNVIHLDSDGREQIAVDGSAHNRIFSNRFSGLDTGGIYLYRNCGEGGTVRHQSPVDNEIFGNVFFYRNYLGPNPAVWMSSRNGWRTYCDDDDGFPWGSSVDNRDLSRDNVVADNLIYVRSVSDMIVDDGGPNYTFRNRTVTSGDPITPGCAFTTDAGRVVYVPHGATFSERDDLSTGTRYRCTNNALTAEVALPVTARPFSCARSGDDAGCSVAAACAVGQQVVGLRAACNLESGAASAADLAATPWDVLRVSRRSDVVSDGVCAAGAARVSEGQAGLGGEVGAARSVTLSCREHDANGGDCGVLGEVLCL